jgi:hypothetical protein
MPRLDVDKKKWLRRLCWIVPSAALIAGVLVFVWQYAWGAIPGLAAERIAPVAVSQSALAPESHLRIVVLPPLDRRYRYGSGPLGLLIENDGDDPGMFTAAGASGGGCIRLETEIVRPGNGIAVDAHGAVSIRVRAHGASALEIPIDTACAREHLPHSEPMELAYSWSIPFSSGKAPQAGYPLQTFAGSIATSPITVTSHRAEFYRHAAAICDQLAKDFTWPVLLAVLGFLAQTKLAVRSDRQQIFNTLLPSFSELVQTHYLPIARRMQIIGVEAKLIAPSPADPDSSIATQRTFCAILLMRRRMQYLFTRKGGIFFRSSVAEKLFSICVSSFYAKFQEAAGSRGECESLAVSLDPGCTLEQAIASLFSFAIGSAADPLLAGFSAWAVDGSGQKTAEFGRFLAVNELAMAVLNFESNRIYYQTDQTGARSGTEWYFDPPQLEFVPDMATIPDDDRKEISDLFVQYLDGVPRECRKGVAYPA